MSDKVKIIEVGGKPELIQTPNSTFRIRDIRAVLVNEPWKDEVPWSVGVKLGPDLNRWIACDDEAEARAIHQQVTDIWAAYKED